MPDVPGYMREAARKGLAYRADGLGGDGLTDKTIREARAIVDGTMSDDKVIRANAWAARHAVDLQAPKNSDADHDEWPGAGAVAHYLWGVDPLDPASARRWLEREAERIKDEGRNMTQNIERRSVEAGWEIRQAEDGRVGLRGYAALFDTPAHGEVIRSSAFTKTLAERADVRLLVNHDGVPIARTKSGSLMLTVDERGLLVDAPDLDMSNPTVQELVSAMSRGDIDQMSFAFIPVREEYDSETRTREILECRLMDCSIVTYPWYESTSVGLKSLDMALAEVRSGAVSPEARDIIIMALGNVAVTCEHEEMESEDDEAEAETEPADVQEDSTPISEVIEPRNKRNLEVARLYLA